jgi:hypothetical protein
MTDTGKSFPFRVFPALMLFCLFVWVWTVAIIMAWPWEKTGEWKADARLPVLCADGKTCAMAYGNLAAGLADRSVSALLPTEPVGELQQPDAWLRWKRVDGQPWQIEASLSSWHFETSLRYRVDDERPVLMQYRHYDAGVFFYALPAALFTLLGVYLRRLRK